MQDMMVDIETFGLDSKSVVLSIGAVMFDRESFELGPTFYVEFTPFLADQVARGRTINPNTVIWWMQQSEEARKLLAPVDETRHRVPVSPGLERFYEFCHENNAQLIWANDPDFDVNTLKSLWADFKVPLNWPFRYSCARAVRTMNDIGKDVQRSPFTGAPHNALDDAIHQATRMQEVFAWLRSR